MGDSHTMTAAFLLFYTTMKRILLTLFFVCVVCSLSAQTISVSRILSDTEMKDYVWAKGYGDTIEEADKDAMNTLVSYVTVIVSSTEGTVSTTDGTNMKQQISMLSDGYLENVRREVLPDVDKKKCVLRYLSREDWEARNDVTRNKILEYIESGTYAPMIEDKLRYFTWAYVLLQTFVDNENPIKIGDKPAKAELYDNIREALNNIKVSVIGVEQDKENRNYPYKVMLDFIYNGEPISFLQFDYFDGSGYVKGESIKDGRGAILMKQLPDEITINIDYLHAELARQLDPAVYITLQNPYCAPSLTEAQKKVSTKEGGKAQKSVDTTSAKVESVVRDKTEEVNESYVAIKDEVDTVKPFVTIIDNITKSIKGTSAIDIKQYFTAEAWDHYQTLVASGNPTVIRTPSYKFIQYGDITICQSIPVKLTFKGNRSFVEDIIFRVNNESMKIESVAYKLSQETEKTIMTMAWDDAARLALISFLEDYRTAYCLKDLEYINKVFAEDAYIIVGRVLQQSNYRFADTPQLASQSRVVYSRKTKEEYIYHLRNSFKSKEFINLRFEECNVAKGYYAKEGIYAVQVRQLYYSNNYADDGILTLAIDMRTEKKPLVRVRIWQQERDVEYNAEEMIERTISVNDGLD